MILNKKGFGLIELMISILVASVIIAGLYQMLTSSVLNFGISSATGRSGKSARQVDNMLNNLVFQAGFINYSRVADYIEFGNQDSGFSSGQFYNNSDAWSGVATVQGGDTTEVNGSKSDSIKFRFYGSSVNDDMANNSSTEANGYIFDCRGNPVPNTLELEMILFVGDKGLVCAQHVLEGNPSADGIDWEIDPQDPEVIDSSIVGMRLLYASTTQNNEDAGKFYLAKNVGSGLANAPDWSDINVVKYAMVTRQATGQKVVKMHQEALKLPLFTAEETSGNAVNFKVDDAHRGSMHRVISGSVSLLNHDNFK